jgi:3-methyladenine DNA glycosylase Tag
MVDLSQAANNCMKNLPRCRQVGLIYIMILKKQVNYESAFYNVDPVKVATFTELGSGG